MVEATGVVYFIIEGTNSRSRPWKINTKTTSSPFIDLEYYLEISPECLDLLYPDIQHHIEDDLGKRHFGAAEAKMFKETGTEIFELAGMVDASDFMPALRWLNLSCKDRRMSVHERANGILQGLVDEHRKKRSKHGDQMTMIDYMLSMQDSEPQQYSDDIIKGQILTMLLAGVDTSSVTIEWAMSLLLNNAEVMGKARAEVDHVVGRDCLVEEVDINNLRYIQNVIKETFRLFPMAPLLVPHEASGDCTVPGFHVPRGSTVVINAWKIHRDPKLWVEPSAFRPESHDGIRRCWGRNCERANSHDRPSQCPLIMKECINLLLQQCELC